LKTALTVDLDQSANCSTVPVCGRTDTPLALERLAQSEKYVAQGKHTYAGSASWWPSWSRTVATSRWQDTCFELFEQMQEMHIAHRARLLKELAENP
jgi:hypothetical protein